MKLRIRKSKQLRISATSKPTHHQFTIKVPTVRTAVRTAQRAVHSVRSTTADTLHIVADRVIDPRQKQLG